MGSTPHVANDRQMAAPSDSEARLPPAFTIRQGRAAGLSPMQLRARRFGSGGRGIRIRADLAPELADRCAALLELLPYGTVLSHQTAAGLYGLPRVGDRSGRIHVSVPCDVRAPRRRGVVAHYRNLRPDEVADWAGLPVSAPGALFLDHGQTCRLEEHVALGDALLRSGLVSPDQLAAQALGTYRRRGVRQAREALPLLDSRAESVPESLFRVRIIGAGLPPPIPQFRLYDDRGRFVARLDLGYPQHRVAIEYDGRQHSEPDQFAVDLRRHTAIAMLGWHILRVGAADLNDGSRPFLTKLGQLLG